MPLPIEDYALLSDTQTAALVGRNGAVDWLCLPRFDSGAIFAALLGTEENGHWLISPTGAVAETRRRYRDDTLILETEMTTEEGVVRLVDFMPLRGEAPDIVRIVEGVRGSVPMRMELILRFDYGRVVPWVHRQSGSLRAIAGPDSVCLRTPVHIRGANFRHVADFTVAAGDRIPFVLTWQASHLPPPKPVDPDKALSETEQYWRSWMGKCSYEGRWHDAVHRSLLTLKALTYEPTGGIVAAATTSLPEQLGGNRNWDYRYCWVRDATLTLHALLYSGFTEEAHDWRNWLLRAVAGNPEDLQIMYGVAGERRIPEWIADWLPGYDGGPVRIGNAAVDQFQLDVYGELIDALYQSRRAGLEIDQAAWSLQRVLLQALETFWHKHDEGIWEVRGPRRPFTYSKVMAWVAFDRAVCTVRDQGLKGPIEKWEKLRDRIHKDVLDHGYDPDRKTFTMYYGSRELDAAVLQIPLVGFLPADDERVVGTIAAIERELLVDGFVQRYTQQDASTDGLPPGEGAFLACSFWLADNYALQGREEDANELFERLLSLRNDVGLLSEEYDPKAGRLVGNFPQAFSHVPLVNSAMNLSAEHPTPPPPRRPTEHQMPPPGHRPTERRTPPPARRPT